VANRKTQPVALQENEGEKEMGDVAKPIPEISLATPETLPEVSVSAPEEQSEMDQLHENQGEKDQLEKKQNQKETEVEEAFPSLPAPRGSVDFSPSPLKEKRSGPTTPSLLPSVSVASVAAVPPPRAPAFPSDEAWVEETLAAVVTSDGSSLKDNDEEVVNEQQQQQQQEQQQPEPNDEGEIVVKDGSSSLASELKEDLRCTVDAVLVQEL